MKKTFRVHEVKVNRGFFGGGADDPAQDHGPNGYLLISLSQIQDYPAHLPLLENPVRAAKHALEAEIAALHPDFLIIYDDRGLKAELNPSASPAFPCHAATFPKEVTTGHPGQKAWSPRQAQFCAPSLVIGSGKGKLKLWSG
jgi:hypothetical protein